MTHRIPRVANVGEKVRSVLDAKRVPVRAHKRFVEDEDMHERSRGEQGRSVDDALHNARLLACNPLTRGTNDETAGRGTFGIFGNGMFGRVIDGKGSAGNFTDGRGNAGTDRDDMVLDRRRSRSCSLGLAGSSS